MNSLLDEFDDIFRDEDVGGESDTTEVEDKDLVLEEINGDTTGDVSTVEGISMAL